MGKGTIGINPFHTDRSLMSPVAVAGLLATIISFTDAKGFVLDKSHWMLYFIVMAMYPVRIFTSLDQAVRADLHFSYSASSSPSTRRATCFPLPFVLDRCVASPILPFSPTLTLTYSSSVQAVDVVGQAGKPRTISGFQTHQTPVRLGQTERAELATEEFMSYSHVLEGCELLFRFEFVSPRRKLTRLASQTSC